MKEVKIRLDEKAHGMLRKKAKEQLRSINKQVTIFILEGLGMDERNCAARKKA